MLQLGSILQASLDLAASEGVLRTAGLMPMSNWNGFGRYVATFGADPWFGVRFDLWKTHGVTPLWLLIFSSTGKKMLARNPEIRPSLESWAANNGGFVTVFEKGGLAIAVDIATGEDKDRVVRGIVDQLKAIVDVVSVLNFTKTSFEV
jgi:hypothetical protein